MLNYRVLLDEKKWHVMNYQIKFKGELQEGAILQDVLLKFANLLKTTPDKVAYFFDGQPYILKQGMSKEAAEQYVSTLQTTGMTIHLVREATLGTLEPSAPPKTLLEKSSSLGLAQDFGAQEMLQYDLYFTGSVMPGFTRDQAIANFAQLSRQPIPQVQALFDGASHRLKKNITRDAALEYTAKLGDIGLFIDMVALAPKVSTKSNFEQLLTEKHEEITLATPIRSSEELAETLKQRHEERQPGYVANTQDASTPTASNTATRAERKGFAEAYDWNAVQESMHDTPETVYEEGGDYCDVGVFDAEARIGRSYYWNLILIFMGIGLAFLLIQLLFLMHGKFLIAKILGFVYRLAMLKFLYGTFARRLHDFNQPSWYAIPLLILVVVSGYYFEAMLISFTAIILLGSIPGTKSDDSPFGPPSPPPTALVNALAFTSAALVGLILLSSVIVYKFVQNLPLAEMMGVGSHLSQGPLIEQEDEYQPYTGDNPIIKMQQKPREVQLKIDNITHLQQQQLDDTDEE